MYFFKKILDTFFPATSELIDNCQFESGSVTWIVSILGPSLPPSLIKTTFPRSIVRSYRTTWWGPSKLSNGLLVLYLNSKMDAWQKIPNLANFKNPKFSYCFYKLHYNWPIIYLSKRKRRKSCKILEEHHLNLPA